ncbi:MAG: mechanosensitive ion channel protein, partial [Verrucomicrobia bacterium]
VIEMNGQELTVESLGPRSTLVRSLDNTQIIVPNSRLLEENVINWTLSDDVVRTRINVGVAYGSPTREVARLLEEIMLGLEEVKPDPAPLANFLDFGESNLLFEASFWSSVHSRKELESELRHRIAERFAQAGIVMAFPQREVSLATAKALRVELLPPASTPPDRSL